MGMCMYVCVHGCVCVCWICFVQVWSHDKYLFLFLSTLSFRTSSLPECGDDQLDSRPGKLQAFMLYAPLPGLGLQMHATTPSLYTDDWIWTRGLMHAWKSLYSLRYLSSANSDLFKHWKQIYSRIQKLTGSVLLFKITTRIQTQILEKLIFIKK